MGWLTRLRIVDSWDRLVPSFRRLSDRLIRLGSDTGGMQMRISGLGTDKRAKTLIWNLTARENHGPEIPCVPALILARRLAAGSLSTCCAFPCLGMITMPEFDAEVSDLSIQWSLVEERKP